MCVRRASRHPIERLVLAALCAGATGAAAQAPSYAARHDTLRYTIDNPYRMYWLRGADTIGPARRELSVESHAWGGTAAQPEVTVHNQLLDVSRRLQQHVFALAPNGRVRTVDRKPPDASLAVDLLLHLPAAPLRAGTSWIDTVRAAGKDAAGPEVYEVIRTYHVQRVLDTLGAREVADVEAHGTIHYRFGFAADVASQKTAWLDVTGPDTERYFFDTQAGRLIWRQWDMHLVGRGVAPDAGDTVPAGLESSEVMAMANTPVTRFLLDPLPGTDTSITFDMQRKTLILLHTTARHRSTITASLTRNDGMVGVASVGTAGSRITDYHATWAEHDSVRTQAITVRDSSLLLVRQGRPDTTVAIPNGAAWAIADYAMDELLGPALLALPRDGKPHPFDVYRPVPARWDTATAMVRSRGGFVVVALEFANEDRPQTLVFGTDGDCLFVDNTGPHESRRVPSGAKRFARFQAAMAVFGH